MTIKKEASEHYFHVVLLQHFALTEAVSCKLWLQLIKFTSNFHVSEYHKKTHPVIKFDCLIAGDFLGIPKLQQLVDDKGKPTGTRMIIQAVKSYNTGRYVCTAVNPHGQDRKTLDLNVP